MFRTSTLLVATLLTTIINAAPLASAPPFEISNLSIGKVMGGNVTFQFTVHDPDPLTDATSICKGEWVTASKAFPTESYEPCGGNTTFAWHMESFDTIKSFVLGIEHTYEDPAVGKPPYDYITNFGKVQLNEALAPCTVNRGTTMCKQSAAVIKAPIYATIAKR